MSDFTVFGILLKYSSKTDCTFVFFLKNIYVALVHHSFLEKIAPLSIKLTWNNHRKLKKQKKQVSLIKCSWPLGPAMFTHL